MATACTLNSEIDSNYYCKKLNLSCIKDDRIVQFKTSKGDFKVKLFGKDNPVAVSNFLENINNILLKKVQGIQAEVEAEAAAQA